MTQTSLLTVVMYHYVRPLTQSAYPRLKALELNAFHAQLDYLTAHYSLVTPAALKAAFEHGTALPDRPCVLTFDDGYADHFDHVFPALQARKAAGYFFAPHMSLVQRELLEVNKVQFILASTDTPDSLAAELDAHLQTTGQFDIQALRVEHCAPNRYDGPEVAYFKRLLQHVLPAKTRRSAIDSLFAKHVSKDALDFASSLYLTVEQAQEMRAHGNEFGGHGGSHLWHAKVSPSELAEEVSGSIAALKAIGAPVEGGSYCYPFGSQNDVVRTAISEAGFSTAFTVQPDLFDMVGGDRLQICRLDTNDLPRVAEAQGDIWLSRADTGLGA